LTQTDQLRIEYWGVYMATLDRENPAMFYRLQ